jgi:hypothetical protein
VGSLSERGRLVDALSHLPGASTTESLSTCARRSANVWPSEQEMTMTQADKYLLVSDAARAVSNQAQTILDGYLVAHAEETRPPGGPQD